MAYVQTRVFDKSKAGTTLGFCLRNTRLGYVIPAKYINAIGAWNHTQQHRDRNMPLGVDVPLYYSWNTDGHINVRLANGSVWNDGRIYASLHSFLANAPISPKPVFLGWGESINDVRVIEDKGEETMNDGDILNINFYLYGEDRGAHKEFIGKDWKSGMYGIFESDYFKVNSRVNEGDVGNIAGSGIPEVEAKKALGKIWKTATYQDILPHIKSGTPAPSLPAGTYLKINKDDVKEVK